MVADSFKIADCMEIIRDMFILLRVQFLLVQLHEISPDFIFVGINKIFHLDDPVVIILFVIADQIDRPQDVLLGLQRHGIHREPALFNRNGRQAKKSLIQAVKVSIGSALFFAFFDKPGERSTDFLQKGHQKDACCQTKDRIDQCDPRRIQHRILHREVENKIRQIEQRSADNHSR